jgi:hypothetical protein
MNSTTNALPFIDRTVVSAEDAKIYVSVYKSELIPFFHLKFLENCGKTMKVIS